MSLTETVQEHGRNTQITNSKWKHTEKIQDTSVLVHCHRSDGGGGGDDMSMEGALQDKLGN